MTKKELRNLQRINCIINNYNTSETKYLSDIYKTYSHDKRRAYYFIEQEMKKRGGRDLKVLSANCSYFTCAYKYRQFIYYFTKWHTYKINTKKLTMVIY